MTFKIGDVVVLKSGGPAMTSEDVGELKVGCCWFVDGAVKRERFPLDAVQSVRKCNHMTYTVSCKVDVEGRAQPATCEMCGLPFDRTGEKRYIPEKLQDALIAEGRGAEAINTHCPRFIRHHELWTCQGVPMDPNDRWRIVDPYSSPPPTSLPGPGESR